MIDSLRTCLVITALAIIIIGQFHSMTPSTTPTAKVLPPALGLRNKAAGRHDGRDARSDCFQ